MIDLELHEVDIDLCGEAAAFMSMSAAFTFDGGVRAELTRMAMLVRNRVERGLGPVVGINPQRFAPNLSDLVGVLAAKWELRKCTCATCGGRLVAMTENRLLQASADTIRSDDGSYA
ncbi:MAG: hypothetical protein EXR79_08840 [Myxococcales bacterium]|nr:hypothetical protein [Myxococcales bacterium]